MSDVTLLELINKLEGMACQCDAGIGYSCGNHIEAQQARVLLRRYDRPIDGKFSFRNGEIANTISGEVIPDDEPIFLLRGRDAQAVAGIAAYVTACLRAGCTLLHIKGIEQVIAKFKKFQQEHPERIKEPTKTQHLRLDPTGETYVLAKNILGRYIIVHTINPDLAWSGARWVPMGGDVQIANFDSADDANNYAIRFGLTPKEPANEA